MLKHFRLMLLGWLPLSVAMGLGFPVGGDLTLPEGTRIFLRLNDYLSTKLNSEGDRFTAEVVAPVLLGDRVVIPKGSIVTGSITRVLRPGRFRGKAVMNVLFHSIRIPGRIEIPIVASLSNVDPEGNSGVKPENTIEGDGSKAKDIAKVATPGATGAGIGGLIGGGKGAAIGGGVGAAIGLATVFATRGRDIEVRRGTSMDIILERPIVVPAETGS